MDNQEAIILINNYLKNSDNYSSVSATYDYFAPNIGTIITSLQNEQSNKFGVAFSCLWWYFIYGEKEFEKVALDSFIEDLKNL